MLTARLENARGVSDLSQIALCPRNEYEDSTQLNSVAVYEKLYP